MIIYPVRNNKTLLPPGQRPSGPAAAAGLDFRIIPPACPERGLMPPRFRVATTGNSNGVYLKYYTYLLPDEQ